MDRPTIGQHARFSRRVFRSPVPQSPIFAFQLPGFQISLLTGDLFWAAHHPPLPSFGPSCLPHVLRRSHSCPIYRRAFPIWPHNFLLPYKRRLATPITPTWMSAAYLRQDVASFFRGVGVGDRDGRIFQHHAAAFASTASPCLTTLLAKPSLPLYRLLIHKSSCIGVYTACVRVRSFFMVMHSILQSSLVTHKLSTADSAYLLKVIHSKSQVINSMDYRFRHFATLSDVNPSRFP